MTNWISELQNNLTGEFANRPVVATLATVRTGVAGPRADARSIVVRDLLEDGTLIITSDARSEKNVQLRQNSSATAVFWLPNLRWQCIVDGQVAMLEADSTNPLRLQQWQKLSNGTRAMFAWPAPGMKFEQGAEFPREIEASAIPPDSFELLMLKPLAVETLDVRAHPHRRLMWINSDTGWTSQPVNP